MALETSSKMFSGSDHRIRNQDKGICSLTETRVPGRRLGVDSGKRFEEANSLPIVRHGISQIRTFARTVNQVNNVDSKGPSHSECFFLRKRQVDATPQSNSLTNGSLQKQIESFRATQMSQISALSMTKITVYDGTMERTVIFLGTLVTPKVSCSSS